MPVPPFSLHLQLTEMEMLAISVATLRWHEAGEAYEYCYKAAWVNVCGESPEWYLVSRVSYVIAVVWATGCVLGPLAAVPMGMGVIAGVGVAAWEAEPEFREECKGIWEEKCRLAILEPADYEYRFYMAWYTRRAQDELNRIMWTYGARIRPPVLPALGPPPQ